MNWHEALPQTANGAVHRRYTEPLLARRLRIGTATVSRKLNARSPWTLAECYQVMDLLGKPYEQIPLIFPRDGRNEESACRR